MPDSARRLSDVEPGALGARIAAALDQLTLEKIGGIGFDNARRNAAAIAAGESIAALRQTPLMAAERALVIAAGPSLHRYDTARMLHQSDFDGALIVSESSMAWCLRNGIIPDLVVTLDPHPSRIVRWFGDPDLTAASLAADDYYARQDMDPKFRERQLAFNAELVELIDAHGSAMRIAVSSSASSAVVRRIRESGMQAYWWNPMYDDYDDAEGLTRRVHRLNGLPCINAGGNVGAACWVFAQAVLRKRSVGLVGMDLGYYGDLPYSRTQYYHEIVDLVGPDRLDEVYIRLTNPHDQQTYYTDPAYYWYRSVMLEMVAGAPACQTHNCTGGGILFGDNIHWTPLEEFLGGGAQPG